MNSMVNWDVYGRYNERVNWVYKPTYNCRVPSCGFANKNGDVFILEIVTRPARLGVFTKNHGRLNQTWNFIIYLTKKIPFDHHHGSTVKPL